MAARTMIRALHLCSPLAPREESGSVAITLRRDDRQRITGITLPKFLSTICQRLMHVLYTFKSRRLHVWHCTIAALALVVCSPLTPNGYAQQPNSLLPKTRFNNLAARVSPVLEIEVLDPNRDARGNPAVTLTTDELGNPQIEIPPSLIVHRYYYTGDRSFRGPDLPGGPSIVIAQNPRDGKQVYLLVQMLPGSPIVHYSSRSIEYDFGNRAVIVVFPKTGEPTVSYRNGRPLAEKAGKLLGVDKLKSAWEYTKETANCVKQKTCTSAQATRLAAGNLARPFTLPAQNFTRFLPGAAALSDPSLEARITEQTAIREQQAARDKTEKQAIVDQVDIKSVR